jgi:hypothetical protein
VKFNITICSVEIYQDEDNGEQNASLFLARRPPRYSAAVIATAILAFAWPLRACLRVGGCDDGCCRKA